MRVSRLTGFVPQDGVAVAALVLLTWAIVFGGASRVHEFRLALVELAALPVAVAAGFALLKPIDLARHRLAFIIVACTAALPLLQLLPLPPAIWSSLPGRDQEALALEVVGLSQGWLPISLTPDRTWRSFLAVLPPLAMFLALVAVRPQSPRIMVPALLILTLLSICLGAAQMASGGVALYPWATTGPGSMTGFFANRNHLATLCLLSVPFAAVWGASALRRGGPEARVRLWLSAVYVALVVIAIAVIRSRAGVVLIGPVLGASLLAVWVAAGRGAPRPALLALVGGVGLALAAVGVLALAPLLDRFDTQGAREGRFENWPLVMEAANTHLPLGSGLGSFDAVFRSVEPLESLDPTFFNQAHNDYIESWLETGWFGPALLVAFLIWFGRRSWTAWRADATRARDLQRAATIAIGVVLVHSAVDYPIRTAAIATVFALCCGLLELAVRSDVELGANGRRRRG